MYIYIYIHVYIYLYTNTIRQRLLFTCLFQNIEDDTKDLKWYGHTVIDIFKKYARFFLLILLKNIQQ